MSSLIEMLNNSNGGRGGKRAACRKEIINLFEKNKELKMFEITNEFVDERFDYSNPESRYIAKRALVDTFAKKHPGYLGFKIGSCYGVVKLDRLNSEEVEYVKKNNLLK